MTAPRPRREVIRLRGWGSAYAALTCGRIDAERLPSLLASTLPPCDPLVFASM